MREKRLLLKFERIFSSVEVFLSYQGVIGNKALKNTPRKKNMHIERNRISAQNVNIINPDDLKVASPSIKRARKERSTTHSKIITESTNRSSDGSRLQHSTDKSTAKPPAGAVIITKMTEDSKKTPEETPQKPGAEARPIIHSGFDDRLSGKLIPSFNKASMSTDDVSRSAVPNRR